VEAARAVSRIGARSAFIKWDRHDELSPPRVDLMWQGALRTTTIVLAAAACYAAVGFVYLVIPLGHRWGEALLGTSIFPHDAVLNAGILEWGFQSLWSSDLRLFDWPAGFPLKNSLAMTENLIGWQAMYSPMRWAGFSIPAAYNTILVFSLVVSGIGAFLFARRLGANPYGAMVAGFIFAFVPFHLAHMVHLQSMAVCWSPFALYFLDRFLATPTKGDAIGLGASLLLTGLSGVYFAAFLVLIVPTYVLACRVFARHHLQWRNLAGLLATGTLVLVLLVPVAIHYIRYGREVGVVSSAGLIIRSSLAVLDLFRVPSWQAVWSGTQLTRDPRSTEAFPGLVALLLFVAFLILKWRDVESRRTAKMLLVLCLIPLVLSLGPVLKIQPDAPWRVAGYPIPLPGVIFLAVSNLRVPMRIALYFFLFGAVLAGLGLSAIVDRLPTRLRFPIAFVIVCLLFIEYRPQSWFAAQSVSLAAPLALSEAYPFLRSEGDAGAVVELPVASQNGYRTPLRHRYIYGSIGHHRRVVSYIGGLLAPRAIRQLEEAVQQLPSNAARESLVAAGVTRLVLHKSLMPLDEATRWLVALDRAGYRRLHEGPEAVVYDLNSSPQSQPGSTVFPYSMGGQDKRAPD